MRYLKLIIYLWLSVLAGDLLYLYYSGGWYDPIKFIEMAEVVFLYIFVVLGLVMFAIEVKTD